MTSQAAPTWVVTVSSDGVDRGMVGPFADPGTAEAWAVETVAVHEGLTWRCDPVVTPAALECAIRQTRRRHLHAVA
jgi:hypothetical protein